MPPEAEIRLAQAEVAKSHRFPLNLLGIFGVQEISNETFEDRTQIGNSALVNKETGTMKQNKQALWLALALAPLLFVSNVRAETLQETLDQTLAFSQGSRLDVENTNGEIVVATWDRDEVRIEARKKARGNSANELQAALDALEVLIEETVNGISIETRFPGKGSLGWSRSRTSLSVNYLITIPSHANLDLETVNGDVSVSGVFGELDIDTTNGGIDVKNSGGRVTASSTNGGISVELAEVTDGEEMRFETTNGGVKLVLPASVRASLNARTTNGSITTDFPIAVQGKIHRTHLAGDINGGGGKIDIRTTNGGIQISEFS